MKIFYGICGEGMGHAGRSYSLVEKMLEEGHEVWIYTHGQGLDLYKSCNYPEDKLKVIDGVRFGYNGNRVSVIKTFLNFIKFKFNSISQVSKIRNDIRSIKPDLLITDFEPLITVASKKFKIPLISIDNQHRFCSSLKGEVPWNLRIYSILAGVFIKYWIKRPDLVIISCFHNCSVLKNSKKAEVMIRKKLCSLVSSDGDYYVVYVRDLVGKKLVEILSKIPEKFIVYGMRDRLIADNLEYKEISYEGFVKDLAGCKGVISQAGHQLIGESKYYGKPILVIPLPNQNEQDINGLYVEKEDLGKCIPLFKLNEAGIIDFIKNKYHVCAGINGVDEIYSLIMEKYDKGK